MREETYNLLEEAVQNRLIGTGSLDDEKNSSELHETNKLIELLITADKDADDFHDKEARRKIEEERNKASNEIEREKLKIEEERNKVLAGIELEKQRITWKKVGVEMAKAVVPLVISLVGYNIFQKRTLFFEEHGSICSFAGRELHLPKIFNK